MINKHKVMLSLLSMCLAGVLIFMSDSFADKQTEAFENGIGEINDIIDDLTKSKIDRRDKLQKDLDIFKDSNTKKIDKDNMFYITYKTGLSKDELEQGLKDTQLKGLGEDFKKAEEKYGINAIFLMAMAKHESGNGTSFLANEKNNLFGFNAIDQDPMGASKNFKSKAESIDYVANFLRKNYLNEDGRFYNGTSAEDINISYASDPKWAEKVESLMIEVAYNILDYKINLN
ncbi:MAG: glucosaminidase domain-containing protein [Peptoniphilaceae bacterium]|nr:glucosaminidase domain-containing protein [Peptoniphilaceae bacterium]MDD7383018.1 glucosaminidase domain-containing protein [Peptoniphilaceae bacterium]MDY3737769.1 glucosaminidase domain-containing protein [Peptoniphilaceae bacterium]